MLAYSATMQKAHVLASYYTKVRSGRNIKSHHCPSNYVLSTQLAVRSMYLWLPMGASVSACTTWLLYVHLMWLHLLVSTIHTVFYTVTSII